MEKTLIVGIEHKPHTAGQLQRDGLFTAEHVADVRITDTGAQSKDFAVHVLFLEQSLQVHARVLQLLAVY